MTVPFVDLVTRDAQARLKRFNEFSKVFLEAACHALASELVRVGFTPTLIEQQRMATAVSAACMSFVFSSEAAPSKGALRDHAASAAIKIVGEVFRDRKN